MKRVFGPPIAVLAVVGGLLAAVAIPVIFAGSATTIASAATPPQQIGMKILVITDSSNANAGIVYSDWVNTLQREGVPYTSVVTSSSSRGSVALPQLSSTLGNGTQVANYEGVVVAVSGSMGLSDAQWGQLQTFEHRFSVRQVTAYDVPSSDYGLGNPNPAGGGPLAAGTPLTLTANGSKVFPYLKQVAVDPTQPTWGYQGTPLPGANVDTLISGPNGSSLLGLYTSADGRQTMYQTFNQNQFMLQSELLRHGELAWLARSTYFGDQRNYLETHVDDNFLPDDTWNTATHSTDYTAANALRETPGDVDYAATWSAQNHFRIDMLFNGGGSTAYAADHGGNDPLLADFQLKKGSFGWVNHTWDHPNLDQGCANATFIDSEITQNNAWANQAGSGGTGGLGLTPSANPATPFGTDDPGALVTGEHAGLANMVPGNPGTVDPPEWDDPVVNLTGGSFAAGSYTYAITDQFSPTGGESSASSTVVAVPASGSVTLQWAAVCHAALYKIYRLNPGSSTWTLVTTMTAPGNSFGNTGPATLSFTDTNTGSPSPTPPPSVNGAVETPYQQNTDFVGALSAAGVAEIGSDASKPYPNPPTATFPNGSPPSATYPAGATFPDGSARAIPRYPTNIFYNVSTEAQEVDEYQTIYDLPTCKPITGVTTCNAPGTAFSMSAIVTSIDQNMFQHMMGNDPRPHYFHQTNLMGQPPAGGASTGTSPATSPAVGNGLFYETLNPLLQVYHQYFADNAPIQQPTMAQVGTLLSEQAGWLAANASQVTGFIQGSVVTVKNIGPAIEIPLTGTTVGTPYGGSQSGWVLAPSGISTYRALAPWPQAPSGPAIVTPPTGPAPGGPRAKSSVAYIAVQTTPKTVRIKRGKVTVSLACKATRGKSARGKTCSGKFTLTVSGRKVRHSFRFKSGKIDRIRVTLPSAVRKTMAARARKHKHPKLKGKLAIVTVLSKHVSHTARGTLTIKS